VPGIAGGSEQQRDSACSSSPIVVYTGRSVVELVDQMGSDLAVVRNARLTTGKAAKVMPSWGPKFIEDLMRKRHGTPFEAAVFTFRVECSIAVAREWFRHRIGSFNEASLRVSTAKPVFYLPDRDQARCDLERYTYGPIGDDVFFDGIKTMVELYDAAWETYQELLKLGWSRELARLVLPVGLYTRFSWTVNARALMNFLELRLAPDALQEIRDAAGLVYCHWLRAMPVTAGAFERCGRIAP
jgi:thymidylate synthase (FAD)